MKGTSIVLKIAVLLCLVCAANVHAQSFEEENTKVMERMDTESLKEKVLLNKAIALDYQLEPFRAREKNKEGAYVTHLDARLLRQLIETAERGNMDGRKKPETMGKIFKRSRKEVTANNVIPVGIINMDAVLLSEAQVEENIKVKSEGKKADASKYENIELIAAGPLQDEVFQGDVQFQLSRELLYGNNKNEIKSVSIDFLDGKGWRKYSLKDELIQHNFETLGEVALYIRLETERGTYITGSKLDIRARERTRPDEVGSVTAEGKENGRLAEGVVGAEFAIYNGCDGVLNKPIIIAEGFDTNDKNGLDDMMGRHHEYFSTFRNHGYDMVYVNYTDGQAAIQDNAQALKRVINEIKSRIPAADSIIYVGASMSGLIGRWALREMENAGQPHKVKLFIGLDAGQQGSYIPPGLVQTRRSLGILGGWKAQLAEMYLPALKTIDAPASKQLLYFHSGTAPHADFYTLKQNLANMGNGGYPALSRNIAIVNGSLNGNRQLNRWGNILTPGEELIDVKALTLLGGAFVKAWSNVPGQNTKTFSGISATFLTPFAFNIAYTNLPVNYDRLPGGYVQKGIDFKERWPVLFGGNINISAKPRFTHMPIFSSIDYRGALNSDADHTFAVAGTNAITNIYNQVINPSLTPFKAIYGNEINNTEHTYAVDITNALNTLALRELGLNKDERLASCPVLSAPPAPQKATLNSNGTWSYSTLQGGRCAATLLARPGGNTITLYVGGNSPDYQQYIVITGPGN